MEIKDLKKGEIYKYDYLDKYAIGICAVSGRIRVDNVVYNTGSYYRSNNCYTHIIKTATSEEKHWLNECIKADKFIPYEEAMKTFNRSFKFNIGDEVYVNGKGYQTDYGQSHKINSLKYNNLYKIIEQLTGKFGNTYKIKAKESTYNHGNLVTEEGLELVTKAKEQPQFEVGKWYNLIYTFQNKYFNIYGKSNHLTNKKSFYFEDGFYINTIRQFTQATHLPFEKLENFSTRYISNLSEIQQYLPDGHIDKILDSNTDIISNSEFTDLRSTKASIGKLDFSNITDDEIIKLIDNHLNWNEEDNFTITKPKFNPILVKIRNNNNPIKKQRVKLKLINPITI